MSVDHRYEVSIRWTGDRGSGTSDYRSYGRDHAVEAEGRPAIPGTSDPGYRGDPTRWNPEQLFVAALSQCHMLWYLHLCSVNGVVVSGYQDRAEGTMRTDENGGGEFTLVLLRPSVTVAEESMLKEAIRLHEEAQSLCFIARSVKTAVTHRPEVVVAAEKGAS